MKDRSETRKFGRYQVVESLGRGSTSTVFKAHDPLLDRNVAIKAIHAELSVQPGFVERFEREARALAHLQHPNIVRIYDMGHEADVYFMVVEMVTGETPQPMEEGISWTPENGLRCVSQVPASV